MTRRIPARCLAAAATVAAAVFALAPPASGTGGPRLTLDWKQCPDDVPGLPIDPVVKCASLRLPVDWAKPHGATFDLVVARRPARESDQRVGTLVFGPGGPGDSGVERIRSGNRFSPEILDKFDTVSFDPRGVGRSGAAHCSPDPTVPKPPKLPAGPDDFDATIAYNRALWDACRRTSPVFDNADTLSTVHDLEALRRALGEPKLTFHGSSYGTLLGVEYAERYPERVRAIVLESVFDHSLDLRTFVRTEAIALQDSFDEFVAWCDRSTDCVLRGQDVRAVWADVLARADRGEYAPYTSFDVAAIPIGALSRPDRPGFAGAIQSLSAGSPVPAAIPPLATPVFCNDWPVPLRDYGEYAELLDTAATVAPDVRYGAGLVAVESCLGWPTQVRNAIHVPHVRTARPLLLLNALHDPRTGYEWATHVADQLGEHGRLVTYEGWGHGSYRSTPCTTAAVDRYLIDLVLPAPGTHCPAP
jgi:pimeloyl-ACP methyl ester carboxylesterase